MTSASGDKVEFACELCQHKLRVPAQKLGRRVRCPYCQGATNVPDDRVACERSLLEARKRTKGGTKTLVSGATVAKEVAHERKRAKSKGPQRAETTRTHATGGGDDDQDDDISYDPLGARKSSSSSGTAARTASTRVALHQFDPLGDERMLGSTSAFHERIKLVDRKGETTVSEASSELAGLESVDPSTLTQVPRSYMPALRRALAPRWHVWVPLGLVGAVLGGRHVEEALYTPLGWLFGIAAVLAVALLWYLALLLMFRKPALYFARVEKSVPLGPWRLVRVGWTTRGPDGGKERMRRLLAFSARLGWVRPGEIVAVALPRASGARPAAVMPYHVSHHLLLGYVEPTPEDAPPTLPCPRCGRTRRLALHAVLGRWVGLLLLFLLWLNVLAATLLSAHLLGTHPATVVAGLAALAGLLLLLRSARPLVRCAVCRGKGRVSHVERPGWFGRLAAAGLVMWVAIAPLGYVAHSTASQVPAFDEAQRIIAEQSGLRPADTLTVVQQNEQRERAAVVAAALAAQLRADGGWPKGADPALGRVPAAEAYRGALLDWLEALAQAAPTAPTAGNRDWDRAITAGAALQQARQSYDDGSKARDVVETLGTAGPTLWFGPRTPGESGFASETARYIRALAAPLETLVAAVQSR